MGVISAGFTENSSCYQPYTKLSGVQAWDPGITMPLN